jgi:magnesium transporter
MKKFQEKITWIDITDPSKADIEEIKKIHQFHPIILDELLQVSARSRVENYDDYLFLTYHLPVYDPIQKTSLRTEIDFLITKDTVITVRYGDIEPLDAFEGHLNSSAEFREQVLGKSSLILTHNLLQSIIAFSLRQLRHIEENISVISREIFKGNEQKLLARISYVKRDVFDYRLISRPQEILLSSLRSVGPDFWGKQAAIYLDDLIGDNLKTQQLIENYLEVVEALESTNAQLLNAKTNRVMQNFTVLAFLTFPLVLFTSIYDVAARTAEFWVGFGSTLLATILIIILFKRRDLIA